MFFPEPPPGPTFLQFYVDFMSKLMILGSLLEPSAVQNGDQDPLWAGGTRACLGSAVEALCAGMHSTQHFTFPALHLSALHLNPMFVGCVFAR